MDNPKAVVRRAPGKGQGVFAAASIKKGEEVAAFDGRILGWRSKVWDSNPNDIINHAIQIAERKWRDSAGIARVLNHSCEPNCGIKDLFTLVAMRDIEAGEELTWDYEMTEDHPWWRMDCRCRTKSCRKVIGAHGNMPVATRKKYDGYISKWLVHKYEID